MDKDSRLAKTLAPSPGEATRRAEEARRRLAELGPEDDATELIQEIGDEQGYVELPVGEYRLSTRHGVVGGGS